MKNFYGGRRSGKTSRLIHESAKTGRYILVLNRQQADHIMILAEEMKVYIPFPVTVDELKHGGLKGGSIEQQGILVDDMELVLQRMIGVPISGRTATIGSSSGKTSWEIFRK